MDATTAQAEMERWNKTNKPPMEERELKSTFESALKKYTRKVKPVTNSEDTDTIKMKDISAKYEGKRINFFSFISAMDEHRTVTIKLEHTCARCGYQHTSRSNGYENPRTPNCDKCHLEMIPHEDTRETEDNRTNHESSNPDKVLDGDLDEFLESNLYNLNE